MEADVGAARGLVLAAASHPPPAAAGLEGEERGPERWQRVEGTGSEEDDGVEITGVREAHKVRRPSTGAADRARPKGGEVET